MCGKCGVIGLVVPAIAMKSGAEKERGRREEEKSKDPQNISPRNG